jgi:hypothetical protein
VFLPPTVLDRESEDIPGDVKDRGDMSEVVRDSDFVHHTST